MRLFQTLVDLPKNCYFSFYSFLDSDDYADYAKLKGL
jgi:hypothetical protein